MNGRDHDATSKVNVEQDIKEMVAHLPIVASVVERVKDDGKPPFEQKSHDLMLASVDKITQQWVDELARVRENSTIIEEMVNEQANKVKNELTKLHLLGAQAMLEATRGQEVLHRLGTELDNMMSGRTAQTH